MTTSTNNQFQPPFDIVAIGSSQGGFLALCFILSKLPKEFPIPILIVQHRSPTNDPDVMAKCLRRNGKLEVRNAEEGELLQSGTVYLAIPGKHLIVGKERLLHLADGEKLIFSRPSINALFYSVAEQFRERTIGVILTGANADGAHGAVAIKAVGGRILVQKPSTCQARQMPLATIGSGCADYVLSLEGIVNALITLVMVPGALDHFPNLGYGITHVG